MKLCYGSCIIWRIKCFHPRIVLTNVVTTLDVTLYSNNDAGKIRRLVKYFFYSNLAIVGWQVSKNGYN